MSREAPSARTASLAGAQVARVSTAASRRSHCGSISARGPRSRRAATIDQFTQVSRRSGRSCRSSSMSSADPPTKMPLRDSASEGVHEQPGGVLDGHDPPQRRGACRDLPANGQHDGAGYPIDGNACRLVGRRRHDLVVDQQAVPQRRAGRRWRTCPPRSPDRSAAPLRSRCIGERRWGAVIGDEVVPGPARSPTRLGERIVVADQVTVDHLHATGGNLAASSSAVQRSGCRGLMVGRRCQRRRGCRRGCHRA